MSRNPNPRTKDELMAEITNMVDTARGKMGQAESLMNRVMRKLRDLDKALKTPPTA